MKKTFLAKRNSLLASARFSWGSFAIVLVLLLLLTRIIAPNFFFFLLSPALRTSDSLVQKTDFFFGSFANSDQLSSRNQELEKENATLALENQTLLQKLNGLNSVQTDSHALTAGILTRPPVSPYDTIIVSSGSAAGVEKGMEAFGEGNTPVGIVSEVLKDFSRVTLFSAPGLLTYGWVGHANTPITIHGTGGGAFSASMPRSAGIVPGDVVFVPGPGKLPIGTVVQVESDPSSPTVILRIKPSLNLFSQTWVELRDVGSSLNSVATSTDTLL